MQASFTIDGWFFVIPYYFRELMLWLVIEAPEAHITNWAGFVPTAVTVICDVVIHTEALHSTDLDHAISAIRIL